MQDGTVSGSGKAATRPSGLTLVTPVIGVILGLVAFVTLGINVGALAVMASQRSDMLEHSDRDIQNLALVLANQTERSFQAIDAVQRNVFDHLRNFGYDEAETIATAGQERFVYDILVQDVTPLKFVNWISVVDAKGRLAASSRSFPVPRLDLTQRDYFKALSGENAPDVFISEPIPTKDTGEMTIYLARRMTDAWGRFSGVLIAGIAVDTFQQFYRGIDSDETSTILLMRKDGMVLSGRGTIDRNQAIEAVAALGQQPTLLTTRPRSALVPTEESGDVWRTAAAPLESYPALVVTQYDVGSLLSDWTNRALFVAALVLLVDISVIVAGTLGFHHLRQSARLGEAERHSARHDILTGLPNRAFFQETLDEALQTADEAPFGLILIDLDNFKEVNDAQGHQAGDELLKLVAARLAGCLGPKDRLARLGGDEFAIVQNGIRDRADIERLAHAALASFEAPFPIRERLISAGASFGIAIGDSNEAADILFDQADMALYQAKALGRGTVRFFSAELQSAKVDRKTLAQDLKEAVREETLELHFQPIVDLKACRLTGFEALLRWNDPVRGPVPPSTFIPIAEETALIGPLGRWVLKEACRQAASWPDELCVAVNLSAVQIQLGDVATEVEAALAESGLDPARLEIEITESVLLDHPSAEKTLHRLVALGVSISLDDFGTGYSSLSYLCSFPFGRIKIDRSFVGDMLANKEAAAIVETVRDLGTRLGIAVTAEGIETHAQLRRLQDMGCDAGQGYLMSRPMPACEVARFAETFSFGAPARRASLPQPLSLSA